MTYARAGFGLAAMLMGCISLLWRDPQTWQSVRAIWQLPFGSAIGAIVMAAQVAGGLAVLVPVTVASGSRALRIVYAITSLTCLVVLVRTPSTYDSFFEQLAMLCGAVALVSSERGAVFARIGLGLSAISFTVTQAIYLKPTADLVPMWIPPNQLFWAIVTTALFALAAIAILSNVRARLAMLLMGLMTALFGLLVWVPILVAHPSSHTAWSEFAITMLIAAASFVVAACRSVNDDLRELSRERFG